MRPDPAMRHAMDQAHRAAFTSLGRPPEHGEWERFLPVWAQQELGVGPGEEPDMEELEKLLVPCGC